MTMDASPGPFGFAKLGSTYPCIMMLEKFVIVFGEPVQGEDVIWTI